MQLSLHADYGLRLLIYLGSHPGERVSTQRISKAYGISKHHLVRVVQTMADGGFVQVTPGRNGGVSLAKDPAEIRLGDVVRHAEPNLHLVECFDPETNTCPITAVCGLKGLLKSALGAFLSDLDRHSLGDLLTEKRRSNLAEAFVQISSRHPGPRAQ